MSVVAFEIYSCEKQNYSKHQKSNHILDEKWHEKVITLFNISKSLNYRDKKIGQ
jgi:hypothetical protein